MNSKAKKSGFRFNFIDAFLLLIILAAVAVVAYIFISPGFSVATEQAPSSIEIEYEIEVLRLKQQWEGLIDIGDKVVDTTTLYTIGEVVERQYSPYIYTGYNEQEDAFVNSEYPDYVTMTVKIKTSATKVSGGYLVGGGYNLTVGSQIGFRTPDLASVGYCTVITEVSGNE